MVKFPAHFIRLLVGLTLVLAARTHAGPPYLTDDPDPTEYQHWEAELFTTGDYHTDYSVAGPVAELDYGVLPDTQVTFDFGMAAAVGDETRAATGLGDVALSVKYRFLHETNGWPELAIFPGMTFPTGDASRGLGNGRATYHLPVWAQKSFGAWTVDGGGGVFFNTAPGARNYPYGGLLVQRACGVRLSLGMELFAQGQAAADDEGYAALNFGGAFRISDCFSLQTSVGHSVVGADHTLWYCGFDWSW